MTVPLLHILLVEDTPTDSQLIQTILRPPSFQVTAVERLSDALAVLRSTRVDVIVLDLMLPDSRGPETLHTVLEQAAGTAVVVITGNDDEQAALDAVAQGAQDYLIKGEANAETIVRSVRYAFERSRAEAQLRASEERFLALAEALEAADQLRLRYELILNSIADGVHGLNPTGNITFQNSAAAAMLGWEGSDLIGEPEHETLHHSLGDGTPHDKEACPIVATLADGVVRQVSDDVFWRKDGTSFPVDYVAAPKRDSEGRMRGVVVAFRDITKQKEMQLQVDQVLRVSSLGRVAATVAHEFNNVLMGIQPFAELLWRRFGDDAVLQKPLKHILDGVKRGRLVSHQILRFASPAEPRLAPLDLGEWTRHFSDEARLAVRDRKLEVGPAESLIVQADAEQLSQVMLNLVTNARDACAAGATISIGAAAADTLPFLRRRLAEPHRFAAVFVRDRGQGIPPEVLDHIFEPLFTTKKSGGTGLGLAVAQQIISEHGGKILVESEPGSGSTFYIALPLEQTFESPEAGGEGVTTSA
jgi:PAS domain S-box-containing protein